MKHLRLFETNFAYNTAKEDLPYPCVSKIKEENKMIYEKENYITLTLGSLSDDNTYPILGSWEFTDEFGTPYDIREFDMNQVDAIYFNGVKQNKERSFKGSELKGVEVKIVFNETLTSCAFMFANCKNIRNINFDNFKSSQVTDMSYMFAGRDFYQNTSFTFNCNTKNVTNMSGMFKKITTQETFFVVTFGAKCNLNNVETMDEMFMNSPKINSVNMAEHTLYSLQSANNMFNGIVASDFPGSFSVYGSYPIIQEQLPEGWTYYNRDNK